MGKEVGRPDRTVGVSARRCGCARGPRFVPPTWCVGACMDVHLKDQSAKRSSTECVHDRLAVPRDDREAFDARLRIELDRKVIVPVGGWAGEWLRVSTALPSRRHLSIIKFYTKTVTYKPRLPKTYTKNLTCSEVSQYDSIMRGQYWVSNGIWPYTSGHVIWSLICCEVNTSPFLDTVVRPYRRPMSGFAPPTGTSVG